MGGVYDIHTGQVDWLDSVPAAVAGAASPMGVAERAGISQNSSPASSDHRHVAAKVIGTSSQGRSAKAATVDSHGTGAATHTPPVPPTPKGHDDAPQPASGVTAAGTQDNFWILGACMACGGAVSYGLIYLLHGRAAVRTA
jgi:hypothetical protein